MKTEISLILIVVIGLIIQAYFLWFRDQPRDIYCPLNDRGVASTCYSDYKVRGNCVYVNDNIICGKAMIPELRP